MRTGIFAMLLPLPLALLTGCTGMYKDRVNQQLWERELRLEEDCIWRLKWELEDKQRELDAANARLQTQTKVNDTLGFGNRAGGGGGTGGPALNGTPLFNPNGGGRGGEAPPANLPAAPGGLPEIDHGQEFKPGGAGSSTHPGSSQTPLLRGPSLSQASFTSPAGNQLRSGEKLDPDVHVDRIALNPGLTGDVNATGIASGKTLSVAIEQRDAHDARVLAPGDISIVVVDPALEGKAARVARWDFDSDEVAKHVRRNRDGGSLQFELPWTKPPQHSDLRLYVRFTTFDGRRLEANLPIDISPNNDTAANDGWTKSNSPIAARARDDGPSVASPASQWGAKNLGSVYDRKMPDSDSSRWESAPQRDASARPVWSPNR